MGSISQMAEKCQKCPNVKRCRKKRMEACAYIDDPCVASSAKADMMESAAAPVLRETVHVCIGGSSTTIYKDELERILHKQLHESLSCAFEFGA